MTSARSLVRRLTVVLLTGSIAPRMAALLCNVTSRDPTLMLAGQGEP